MYQQIKLTDSSLCSPANSVCAGAEQELKALLVFKVFFFLNFKQLEQWRKI